MADDLRGGGYEDLSPSVELRTLCTRAVKLVKQKDITISFLRDELPYSVVKGAVSDVELFSSVTLNDIVWIVGGGVTSEVVPHPSPTKPVWGRKQTLEFIKLNDNNDGEESFHTVAEEGEDESEEEESEEEEEVEVVASHRTLPKSLRMQSKKN